MASQKKNFSVYASEDHLLPPLSRQTVQLIPERKERGKVVTPSELWLRQRPHATLNDYVQAMQGSPSRDKQERFLDAMAPGVPRGTFKWSKTGSNGYLLAVWGLLASLPLFGLLIVVWDVRGRK